MLKKTVTYANFLGEEKTQTIYLHLTKTDFTEMLIDGDSIIDRIGLLVNEEARNGAEIYAMFRHFTVKAYGEVSEDGESFIKTEEAQAKFAGSALLDQLLMDIMTGEENPIEFISAILPADLAKLAKEKMDEEAGKPQDRRKKAGK